MQAGSQNRTGREMKRSLALSQSSRFTLPELRFSIDSKPLSRFQYPLVCKFFVNGLERAFSEAPAKLKVFHSEAARRAL
jgi:hypothetical protein